MGALLQLVPPRVAGAIDITIGTLAPDHFANGLPYEADGTLAVDTATAIDHHHQGLPFTAVGRLATASGNPTYFGMGASPFTAANRLNVVIAAVDHYSSGVGYTVTNSVAAV